MQLTKVSILDKNLDTELRRGKAKQAAAVLQTIVNSPEFRQRVLAMHDKWRMGESSKYKNYTTAAIYQLIMQGAEEWNPVVDHTINLVVDDYYTWKRVVGYMIPGKRTIWVNTKYFDTNDLKFVVSNFLHEYLHTLGFRHSGPYLRSSIPYFINEVVEALYDELIMGKVPQEPQGHWNCFRTWYTLWLAKKCYWQPA